MAELFSKGQEQGRSLPATQDRKLVVKGKDDIITLDPKRELDQYQRITKRDVYYAVGGKDVPSARLARIWADENGLVNQIVDAGKNKENAWCRMKGWRKDDPSVIREAFVCLVFEHMLVKAVYDAIANGLSMPSGELWPNGAPRMRKVNLVEGIDWEVGPDGWPIIINPGMQFQVMRNHLQRIGSAERIATTQAERAVFLKLLGYEWHHEQPEGPGKAPVDRGGEEEDDEWEEEKEDIIQLRNAIWGSLLTLCDGSAQKAFEKLYLLSEVTGQFTPIHKPTEITEIEHAKEILARVKLALKQDKGIDPES